MDFKKSFSVLPMGQNIALKRGETYSGEISVAIPSDATEDFNYSVSVSPYSVIDDGYTADLISKGAYTQIVDWIKIEEPEGSVEPNGVKKIRFKIEVPEDAPVGGQYAALMVGQKSDEVKGEGASIQNLIQIASILYATVEGEIVKGGEILENNIPGFSFSNSVNVGALIRNDGNTHAVAAVKIKVTNFFTGEVIFPKNEEENNVFSEVIMPETTRYATREVNNLPVLGIVNILQDVTFNGETVKKNVNVIICPVWFLGLVILSIAAIITFIVLRIRANKKRSTLVY